MNSFLQGPPDETPQEMLARWRRGQKELHARLRAGGKLTREEEQWLDFVTQKINDWESDWDVQP